MNSSRRVRLIKKVIFITTALCFSSVAVAKERLIFSVDLVRHGARTPLSNIPKSPIMWKEGLGELTQAGIQQEIQLGRKLRKLYIDQYHLLPNNYHVQTMHVYSTGINRTINSADALLLGLYPMQNRKAGDFNIPIITDSVATILTTPQSRNIFANINRYYAMHKLWQLKTAGMRNKLNDWSNKTGIPLINFLNAVRLGDNLSIRLLSHQPLPEGMSRADAGEIIALGEQGMLNNYRLKSVTHRKGRAFLQQVASYFNYVAKTPLKYVLFMGHDSTIMSVLNTLGAPLESVPSFASRLNFSLFANDNRYYVKVTYNDKPVHVPACGGSVCILSQFEQLGKDG